MYTVTIYIKLIQSSHIQCTVRTIDLKCVWCSFLCYVAVIFSTACMTWLLALYGTACIQMCMRYFWTVLIQKHTCNANIKIIDNQALIFKSIHGGVDTHAPCMQSDNVLVFRISRRSSIHCFSFENTRKKISSHYPLSHFIHLVPVCKRV